MDRHEPDRETTYILPRVTQGVTAVLSLGPEFSEARVDADIVKSQRNTEGLGNIPTGHT